MTKKNITRTSIVLLILVLIIGINLAIAKAKTPGVASAGLQTVDATLVSLGGKSGALEKRDLVAGLRELNTLTDGVLNVDAENLSGASLHLLNA